MTENKKLCCPFCGAEMEREVGINNIPRRWHYCVNESCRHRYTVIHEDILQELRAGKAAQDALKKARELYSSLAISHCVMADSFSTSYGRLKTFEQEAEEYMKEYDKEIASIIKQENELCQK